MPKRDRAAAALAELLTVDDVMAATGMRRVSVHYHIRAGTLATYRLGRRHLIARAEFERFLRLPFRKDVGRPRKARPAAPAEAPAA